MVTPRTVPTLSILCVALAAGLWLFAINAANRQQAQHAAQLAAIIDGKPTVEQLAVRLDKLACDVDDLRAECRQNRQELHQDIATLGTEFDRLRESLTVSLASKRDEAPGGEPVHIWITFAPENILCAPCERLRKAIANGELAGFEIQELDDTGRVTSWPAIEFTNKAGQRRIIYGWSSTIRDFIKANAR